MARTTEQEDELYSRLYKGNYGRTAFKYWDVITRSMEFTDRTIIDVGCGDAWIRNKIRHGGYTGIDVASVFEDRAKDWAPNEKFVHLDVRKLSVYPQADICISLDLLEHIEEESIDSVIKNIISWGKETVIGIACFPHVVKQNKLHVTVKTPDWWRKKVEKYTVITHEFIVENYCLFFISERDIMKSASIPYSIDNMRIRRSDEDGSFTIARRNVKAEKYLDDAGIRCPNQLKWFLPLTGIQLDFTSTCYIVGKGPSLDNLTKEYFEPGCSILCINESIHKVKSLGLDNPLYMFQQDEHIGKSCQAEDVISVISPKLRRIFKDYPDTFVIHPRTVGPESSVITALFAMNTAQHFGVKDFKFMCFDACVNQKCEYAECVGYSSNEGHHRPSRFLGHRKLIERSQGDSVLQWIIPSPKQFTL